MKIKKIEIETSSGKSVELTLDEAKELHDQLHELFGKESPYPIFVPYEPPTPYWKGPWYYTTTGDNTMLFNSSTGLKTSITCEPLRTVF